MTLRASILFYALLIGLTFGALAYLRLSGRL